MTRSLRDEILMVATHYLKLGCSFTAYDLRHLSVNAAGESLALVREGLLEEHDGWFNITDAGMEALSAE